jgi:dTMP kinase
VSTSPLIVLEALDAGGSQTQTDRLVARLKKAGVVPVTIHFPQEDRATGRLIYDKFLLHKNKLNFSRREQALLYIQDFFSRAEELWQLVNSSNKIIVLDRYYTSTMAYQTIGLLGKTRQKLLKTIQWLCTEDEPRLPRPDTVLLIDTPVEVSLRRLRDKKKDFFENKQKLTAIRRSYLTLAQEQKWKVVAAVDEAGHERTREDLHEEIWRYISKYVL